MKTKTITIYSAKELSPEAQEKAWSDWQVTADYAWTEDNRNTLKAFEDIFPVKVKDYEYGYRKNIDWRFTADDKIEVLSGARLAKYLHNNYATRIFKRKYIGHLNEKEKYTPVYSKCQVETSCVLTGYCIDDDILAPVYAFLKKPKKSVTFSDLMGDCLESWLSACEADYEACQSLEYFIDHADATEYEFLETGERA